MVSLISYFEVDYSLRSPQSFYAGARSVRFILQTRKTPQKRTLKIPVRHLLVNLKDVRVLAPPLFSIEIWRRCQPLMFPPIQVSNGALRSVKHERRNVVLRVRGCKMTKSREELYGMQTQQGVLLSDLLVEPK